MSAFAGIEKHSDSSSGSKNREFVEHCRKLLLLSLLPEQPSFGLFQELQNTVACQCCQKQSFFVRIVERPKKKEKDVTVATSDEFGNGHEHESCSLSSENYCFICYVEKFCNVHTFQNHDGSEINYIFREKGSNGRILYQSSSMIQRLVCSE
jgi:hypothetical protein